MKGLADKQENKQKIIPEVCGIHALLKVKLYNLQIFETVTADVCQFQSAVCLMSTQESGSEQL